MKTMPSFRITYNNGSSYVTSMAAGVTLAMVREYFLGKAFTQRDERTTLTVVDVVELQCETLPVHEVAAI